MISTRDLGSKPAQTYPTSNNTFGYFDHATLNVSHEDMLEYKFYDRSVASKRLIG